MPDFQRHIEQARHNEKLLFYLQEKKLNNVFSDWYVTVAFYSAVHYFESVLYKRQFLFSYGGLKIQAAHSNALLKFFNSNSQHYVRRKVMLDHDDIFGKIYNPYQSLYEMSRVARYDCNSPNSHDIGGAEKNLEDVKKECTKLSNSKKKKI